MDLNVGLQPRLAGAILDVQYWEVTMRVLTGRNAIAFASIMYFFDPLQHAFAEAIINPACSKLKMIGDELVKIKEQRESITGGNEAQRCPLYKQQLKYNDEMINIFESDSNRCGVTEAVLERLKLSTAKLRVSTSSTCS
jgi:hypothetical protein